MIADLFLRGKKILFFTAYPMARDDFMEQIKGKEGDVSYVTHSDELSTTSQCIILQSGNEELFLEAVQKLPDISERVILLKNFETFGEKVFDAVSGHDKIILSGNIDTSIVKEKVIQKKFQTTIVFITPQLSLGFAVPPLEKYTGYFHSTAKTGLIRLETTQK